VGAPLPTPWRRPAQRFSRNATACSYAFLREELASTVASIGGNVDGWRKISAHMRIDASVLQDVRYAWRMLRRQPGYAYVVLATMALGIAATTVLVSIAYGVLLKPLPWTDAPRLVRLYETRQGSTGRLRPMMTNATYLAWRDSPATLDAIGAWTTSLLTLEGPGPERIRVAFVTPSVMPMLGATAAVGRTFQEGEEDPGRAQPLILSHGFWQTRFGGRADVIGRTARLDDTAYTIVGVMPAAFAFPDRETRAWAPLYVPPVASPNTHGKLLKIFQAIGRLRTGVSAEQAAAEGTARGRSAPSPGMVAVAVFGSSGPVDVRAVPLLQALTEEVRPAILVLLAAVALLLATATANVASVQLARATARRRELAIRTALGAARRVLVRHTLVENLLLGIIGGAVGLLAAAVIHRALPSILPSDFPRLDDLAFDWRIQIFAIAISVAAGLACGCLPAWHVARNEVIPALAEDGLAPIGGGLRSRTSLARAIIMASQVAIACVLLIGAVLLGRSLAGLWRAELGYDASNLLTARLRLPDPEYADERRVLALDRIVTRWRSVPGVTHASYATVIPFGDAEMVSSFPVKKRDGTSVQVQTGLRSIDPTYFSALGQKLLEGRAFTGSDTRTSAPVAIVNREFARRFLDGKALEWWLPGQESPLTIVGVVEDTVRHHVTDTSQPEVYRPAAQLPPADSDLNLIVRTTGDPRAIVPALRAIVAETAAGAPIDSISTMQDLVGSSLARPRLYAVLLGSFAGFALAIAGVGLFGVLSYSVSQRSREIGVRAALGAQVSDILLLVLRQSLGIAIAGLAAGVLLSLWLSATLQKFLYGVTPHDAVSFAVVAVVLLLMALAASAAPARRAARIDPVRVLRGQ
jgi:predicted permease